jgi:hypothetical protein
LANIDKFGDSYTVPLSTEGLRDVFSRGAPTHKKVMGAMKLSGDERRSPSALMLDQLESEVVGALFAGCVIFMDQEDEHDHRSVIPVSRN